MRGSKRVCSENLKYEQIFVPRSICPSSIDFLEYRRLLSLLTSLLVSLFISTPYSIYYFHILQQVPPIRNCVPPGRSSCTYYKVAPAVPFDRSLYLTPFLFYNIPKYFRQSPHRVVIALSYQKEEILTIICRRRNSPDLQWPISTNPFKITFPHRSRPVKRVSSMEMRLQDGMTLQTWQMPRRPPRPIEII